MKITTLLLQHAAAKGLTLAAIGQILCRPDDDDTVPSMLEEIVQHAEKDFASEDFSSLSLESKYFLK